MTRPRKRRWTPTSAAKSSGPSSSFAMAGIAAAIPGGSARRRGRRRAGRPRRGRASPRARAGAGDPRGRRNGRCRRARLGPRPDVLAVALQPRPGGGGPPRAAWLDQARRRGVPDRPRSSRSGTWIRSRPRPRSRGRLRLGMRVIGIARAGLGKVRTAGRELRPFEVRTVDRAGREEPTVRREPWSTRAGTWVSPNPAGAGGLPAIGERGAAASGASATACRTCSARARPLRGPACLGARQRPLGRRDASSIWPSSPSGNPGPRSPGRSRHAGLGPRVRRRRAPTSCRSVAPRARACGSWSRRGTFRGRGPVRGRTRSSAAAGAGAPGHGRARAKSPWRSSPTSSWWRPACGRT